MERLKNMKETLVSCIQGQMTHLDTVDTKELGEVVDMVKDLEEAIYYCTITKAMEKDDKNERRYYVEPMYPYYEPWYANDRDMDKDWGRMYYNGNGRSSSSSGSMNTSSSSGNGNGGSRYYMEREYPMELPVEIRDKREGRSSRSRKSYMESKEMHMDKAKQMKELEKYMQELSTDITEMIENASPEEKQYLSSKISTLATKVSPSK